MCRRIARTIIYGRYAKNVTTIMIRIIDEYRGDSSRRIEPKISEYIGFCESCFWCKWGYCFAQEHFVYCTWSCTDYADAKNEIEPLGDTLDEWLSRGGITEEEIEQIKRGYRYDG